MTEFHPWLLFFAVFFFGHPLRAETNPDVVLNGALQLADFYNWIDAAPAFREAERLYGERGDDRNALYAKLGRIRSTMEQVSMPEIAAWLTAELERNPILQNDNELRLFCLVVKGDIDGELDSGPMRQDWEAVRSLAQTLGNKKWQNRASGEIGFAAFLEGDLTTATQMVAGALLGATAAGDIGAQIRYLAAIGTGMALIGGQQESLTYFDKALAISSAHSETGYQFLIHEGRLQALEGLGKWGDARQLADEMLKQARAKGKRVKECQVLITSSRISEAQKDSARAAAELEGAIALAKTGGYKRLLADAQFYLADVYRKMGDLPRAEEIATVAADSTQSSGEIYLIPKRLQSLAQLKVSRGKYNAAAALYRKASDFVDSMLAMVPNVATKSALIIAMSELYTEHFSLLADQLHDVAQAYNVLERARGRVTTDLLRNGSSTNTNADQAREIDRQISRLRLQLLTAKTLAQVRRIRDRIFLVEQTRWLAPQTIPLRARSSETIPQHRISESLGSDQVIVEYVLAEPHSYCLVIGNSKTQIINLPARHTIETLASEYLKAVKGKRLAISEAKQLYSILLASVPDIANKSRLVVVPDGRLHLLSFDALVDPNGRYLVTTHRITYASSASAFYLLNRTSPAQFDTATLLAIGGVPYDQTASVRVALTRGFSGTTLGNLPGSKDEVLAAADALPSPQNVVLIGPEATEAAFKRARLERRAVIHLAVHGIANEKHPDRAALILLSDAAAGEDGILQLSEIVQLRLNADLVVLSACDTAVGRLLGEEGISNISRAFLLAGAKTVVSTLWSIDDNFSLYLMKRFYAHLTAGETTGAALTGAKRDMLNAFGPRAVPYYWAGFVLEGVADRPIGNGKIRGEFAYVDSK